MRIGLLNEGTYPVTKGGVSTWCDQLINQLEEHEWHVVTLVAEERRVIWPLPDNVASTTLVPMWDAPPARRLLARFQGRRQRRNAAAALVDLWRGVLPAEPGAGIDLDCVRTSLRTLSLGGPVPLSRLLTDHGSSEAILAAWTAHRAANPRLPELTLRQAAQAAALCDRMMMVMDAAWPQVDVINASSNGAAALLGLARHWRDGTPLVLTEHGVFLRERYVALDALGWSWAARYVALTFTKAVCQLTYADADVISPVSRFNGRWEAELGADRHAIVPIPNGVDPALFPEVEGEPDEPVISFVGRIDPLKDLQTLIEAFGLVLAEMPRARLRLFGPTPPTNSDYREGLETRLAELGIADSVAFEGPVPSARPAIEAGQVVALSSISEGLPFTVIEAMMSGRPTVSTDVGGVSEVTGRDGEAALLVPPRDPRAFAEALLVLLRDRGRRLEMGRKARSRMLQQFSLTVFAERYSTLYTTAAAAGFRRTSRTCPHAATSDPLCAIPGSPCVVGCFPEGSAA